ncbi:hypothetical protein XELAEV_18028263mg [Xenopus laevis]|uniref:Uncharacterized protein n=1 Tax=Xenopus laevis TaxID=8355 RepID=A0A974CX19_XENLA|nr:hypothetical protein XELAEV_18028263mg [Xenopus laevis]
MLLATDFHSNARSWGDNDSRGQEYSESVEYVLKGTFLRFPFSQQQIQMGGMCMTQVLLCIQLRGPTTVHQ